MTNVSSFSQLKTALNIPGASIKLLKDIPIIEPISIPRGSNIQFGAFKFLGRSKSIVFDGSFEGFRQQYFFGFKPGEIKGSFSSSEIYPEWWGLEPDKNEIAINCAIQSFQHTYLGHKVSLASGYYYVSGPIDLRTSLSYLVGASSGATFIVATNKWESKFEDSNFWNHYTKIDPKSHAAIIWIGSVYPANQSFRTGVKGLSIHAWEAAKKYPDKYISCISSTGYIEENSVIEDVCLSGFSGFGIGATNGYGISTINGLSIRNFWITAPVFKTSVAIHIPRHSGVAAIRDGTIDVRIGESNLKDGMDWPTYGMVISGAHTVVDNLHIEGCGVGIFVESTDTPCSVSISNISVTHLMDYGMKYFDEETPNDPAPGLAQQKIDFPGLEHKFYNKYSSAIVIGRTPIFYASSLAYNVTATISNVRNSGRCKYLLRDGLYNVHFSPFGRGQYPNQGRAALTYYARAEGFVPSEGAYPYGAGSPDDVNQFTSNPTGLTIGPI